MENMIILKRYVDNNKSATMTDEEFNNVLSSKLVVKEDNDDLMFFEVSNKPK